ncbi:flagellar biosynthesis protein FlhA [Parvularcula dongshanensis]|uniref:Flagellar biosynthesis protein FlhA n=1 Tax=Parvularcula dongshanensis TaxID=1173995 RepID=A0A840I5Q3_9PROT|nr:flagellar biosynthesis protein FlhA [Parvularcula dongshanensis]MBB4659645.1 flagellar biosynthesis protein FlhA [Parvularcula dongshanensis]
MSATAAASPLRLDVLRQPTVLLTLGLMVIIVMMILPVPPILLDIGLTASFAFAILIFTIALFIEKPLDFSSFPSVLLIALLLRLALNISSTKLIIGEGHTGTAAAGGVIEGFAMFVMGGNLFLGLIVFCVLIIVNFLVITKGAGRMAEVGARFALDAMPGKQLAIDAEVAAGAISHEEARRLRDLQQEETAFLGSLDGVSKFVKGDAVAGLLITLLNIVAGLIMGLVVHKISLVEAIQNYSILTVGDGLVSQIPAVIISIAAALLLSKGRGEGSVDAALIRQFTARPLALGTVGVLMAVFAFLPGLPFVPFMLGAGGLGYAAYAAQKTLSKPKAEAPKVETAPAKPKPGDSLDLDEIHLELDRSLSALVSRGEDGLDKRIEKLRDFVITRYGFVMPPIRVTDGSFGPGTYRIVVQGAVAGTDKLEPGSVLALVKHNERPDIQGSLVKEPVYGAEARWVSAPSGEQLSDEGITVIEPVEVLTTHLLEAVQNGFERLMTRRALRESLGAFTDLTDQERAAANKRLLDEFMPEKVAPETLQWVMRGLLAERISVRNIPLLLDAIVEHQPRCQNPEDLVEAVRRQIAFTFIEGYRAPDGSLPLVQLSPRWEETFKERLTPEGGALTAADVKGLGEDIQTALNKAAAGGAYAAVAVTARRRRIVRDVLRSRGLKNPVLAFEEIGPGSKPAMLAVA